MTRSITSLARSSALRLLRTGSAWALTALTLALLAGCPSSDENAPTLWLALDGRETEVKLVDFEPPPY